MKFILGQKKQMTQVFKEDGTVIGVTVVEALPNAITQVKTIDKDGYVAVQIGSGVVKKSHNKQQLGHLKEMQPSRWLREFRFGASDVGSGSRPASQSSASGPDAAQADMPSPLEKFAKGVTFGVEIFRPGDSIQVTGVSKGKGFQGVVKRHGFHGQKASHGNKDQLRMPGSIGATGPARVFKGMRMGGRMGTDQVTAKGLQVVKVDRERNLLYIKGALPGHFNSLVMISGPGTFRVPTDKPKNEKTPSPEVSSVQGTAEKQGEKAADGAKEGQSGGHEPESESDAAKNKVDGQEDKSEPAEVESEEVLEEKVAEEKA